METAAALTRAARKKLKWIRTFFCVKNAKINRKGLSLPPLHHIPYL
jgi:hypothetical protein